MSRSRYVLLLNNDTVCSERMVEELHRAMDADEKRFSCAAKMIRLSDPSVLDDAGDFYCALGWAFARGKGQDAGRYSGAQEIFACCAAAAIYRRSMLEETGLLDERHFAYLEDIDLGYRAQIFGFRNWYVPAAVVYHAGSATSGSAHNAFKVKLASRNSVYLIWKNMPGWQILLNAPFWALEKNMYAVLPEGCPCAGGREECGSQNIRRGITSGFSCSCGKTAGFVSKDDFNYHAGRGAIRCLIPADLSFPYLSAGAEGRTRNRH